MKIKYLFIIILATLLLVNQIIGFGKRKEELTVAPQFKAIWKEYDGEKILIIDGNKLTFKSNGTTEEYHVEKTIWYQDGPPFVSYLFGIPKYAIVCDRNSTLRNITSIDLAPPPNYRRKFYFTLPDSDRMIHVDKTIYAAIGEDAGAFTFPVGLFQQIKPL
jgi:hypothetical protein